MARILLAEDDTTMRVFLAKASERAGHEVFAVGDGLEALAAAKAVQFDLLVADVVMPSLDGFQLAARARVTPSLRRHQSFLMISSIPSGESASITLSVISTSSQRDSNPE